MKKSTTYYFEIEVLRADLRLPIDKEGVYHNYNTDYEGEPAGEDFGLNLEEATKTAQEVANDYQTTAKVVVWVDCRDDNDLDVSIVKTTLAEVEPEEDGD